MLETFLSNEDLILPKMGSFPNLDSWTGAIKKGDLDAANAFSGQLVEVVEMRQEKGLSTDSLEAHVVLSSVFAATLIHSRRVFQPSKELVEMLLHTDTPDFRIDSLKFTFDSFVVILPEPIITPQGVEHSVVFFSSDGEGGYALATFSLKELEEYQPLGEVELEDAIAKYTGADPAASFEGQRIIGDEMRKSSHVGAHTCIFSAGPNSTVAGIVKRWTEEKSGFGDFAKMLKIVIGLNLYLLSGRDGDTETTTGVNTDTPKMNDLIGDVQFIELSIGAKSKKGPPSDSGAGLVGKCSASPKTHWRRGHWRRVGEDLADPLKHKLSWIRPTIVNALSEAGGVRLPVGLLQPVE